MNPMLATAATVLPVGEQWAYEFKWDGIRALLDVTEHGVRIHSRAGNDVTAGYPEIAEQAAELGDALLDGELVAFVDGRPSFAQLQTRMHVRGTSDLARLRAAVPVTFVAFDILRRFGVELTARPWRERRATLERLAQEHPGWTLSPSFDDAQATESVARAHGLEGVVAKRVDSLYRPGARTEEWRKLRFVRAGEFVVLGWEAAPEHPRSLTSLVLGAYGPNGLHYAGRVGSGVSARVAERLLAAFTETAGPPLPGVPGPTRARRIYWVAPTVVVDVEYAHITHDGVLRQPVYRGIRPDKRPEEATGDG
jgi:bifunctional non-homologous end joining protein LigD